ncbi:MAG: GHKL domain-containing protein [Candidatus Accumulibacter sp.]|jgi:two-component system C4-dicarboxylate transport sensor histidine kinase DctB|nr:GHKL domain-containing protein [Accumulibacter sp.]
MGFFKGFLPIGEYARGWRPHLLLAAICCLLSGWVAWRATLTRQIEQLGRQTLHRAEFYRFNLESLLARNASLPRVITMEGRLKDLLKNPEEERARSEANDYLMNVANSADLNATYLMDRKGLTLAASNHRLASSFVGHNYSFRPYYIDAMLKGLGIFYGVGATTGYPGYFITGPVEDQGERIGAVTVKISLEDFEMAMIRSGDKVFLTDAHGIIFLASVREWKYHSLMPLGDEVRGRISASRQYGDWRIDPLGIALPLRNEPQLVRLALPGDMPQDYLVQSVKTGPLGWWVVLLAETRREQQNAWLAGIAAGLTMAVVLLAAIHFRLRSLRHDERRQAAAALRRAHDELERRIAERTADLRAANASLEEKIETLKTTESILQETRDAAVQAGKLAVLGQMAAGIGHEVNQPLTALHALTDNATLLLEHGQLGEVRENLGAIKQMATRIGLLVSKVKHFARKPSQEKQAARVADVMDQALMLVEIRRKRAEARIDVQGIPGDLRVIADPQRLEQVFVNLLLNALDAVSGTAARCVSVAAARSGGRVRIAVRDSGPGIAEAALPRLFEPFFTTKEAGQGLGLGLAISRMIAAELGGDLEARNHEDGGAEFTVILEAA